MQGALRTNRREFLQIAGRILAAGGMLATGCSHTRPLVPYTGVVGPNFYSLESMNPALGKDLRDLPDVHELAGPDVIASLDSLAEMYLKHRDDFEQFHNFSSTVGGPKRKYNSILEGAFWMVQDGKANELESLLKRQTSDDTFLRESLDSMWELKNGYKNTWVKLDDSLLKVYDNLNKRDDVYLPDRDQTTDSLMERALVYHFWNKESYFNSADKKILSAAIKNNTRTKRWADFETVKNRCNDPRLIDYWEQQTPISHVLYYGPRKNVMSTFRSKVANCHDTTNMTVSFLRNAGYKAGNILTKMISGDLHNITYYHDKGLVYTMDNGKKKPTGIAGPYKKIEEAPINIIRFVS